MNGTFSEVYVYAFGASKQDEKMIGEVGDSHNMSGDACLFQDDRRCRSRCVYVYVSVNK